MSATKDGALHLPNNAVDSSAGRSLRRSGVQRSRRAPDRTRAGPRAFHGTFAAALSTLFLAAVLSSPLHAQRNDSVFSFVVIGHVRGAEDGALNPRLTELVARLREIRPDLIFLGGDLIAGNQIDSMADPAIIRHDWAALDSALATVGAPIYRVPGNHDLHDPVTRDIRFERYGRLPQSIDFRGTRFLLLSTVFVPQGNAPMPPRRSAIAVRDSIDDPAEIEFLRQEVTRAPAPRNVFVLMHHQLWWKANAPWWRTEHPLLVGHNVRAVFAGDRGPIGTFSHTTRDGIEYLQSNFEYPHTASELRERRENGHRYAEFPTFLLVRVSGTHVDYDVRTVAALTSNEFLPETFRRVTTPDSASRNQRTGSLTRLLAVAGGRRRLFGIALIAVLCFAAGVAGGARFARASRDV